MCTHALQAISDISSPSPQAGLENTLIDHQTRSPPRGSRAVLRQGHPRHTRPAAPSSVLRPRGASILRATCCRPRESCRFISAAKSIPRRERGPRVRVLGFVISGKSTLKTERMRRSQ